MKESYKGKKNFAKHSYTISNTCTDWTEEHLVVTVLAQHSTCVSLDKITARRLATTKINTRKAKRKYCILSTVLQDFIYPMSSLQLSSGDL